MSQTNASIHFTFTLKIGIVFYIIFLLTSCTGGAHMEPDFDAALKQHFAAIANRDIEAFTSHLTRGKTLYTIVQNGYAFTTPSENIEMHKQWFQDPNWTWNAKVVHKVVGKDVAMALIKYEYRPNPEATPFSTWLTYVFQLEEGQWRIIHDQNTALDYAAFARAAGIEIK